ncbi:hypothetical protein BKA82DRAFT_2191879 [Pisolithus tinctorius]|nr:hypothetical protein BKA82DRAFT_2191879 [Pisolithus tinctorius]
MQLAPATLIYKLQHHMIIEGRRCGHCYMGWMHSRTLVCGQLSVFQGHWTLSTEEMAPSSYARDTFSRRRTRCSRTSMQTMLPSLPRRNTLRWICNFNKPCRSPTHHRFNPLLARHCGSSIELAGFQDVDGQFCIVYKVDGSSLGGRGPVEMQVNNTPRQLCCT